MTPDGPLSRLPELVYDVQQSLQEGAVFDGAPLPGSYRDAVKWLTARNYLRSSRYRAQCWRANIAGLEPALAEFYTLFQRAMAKLGVPVHADVAFVSKAVQARWFVLGESADLPGQSPYNTGFAVSVVHSVKGRDLPCVAWEVFAHVGREVAAKLGLGVQWGGVVAPWQWVLTR